MRKAGIILIILQILGTFGRLINGSLIDMFINVRNAADIVEILGFFLLGIIGAILLLKAPKADNESKTKS